MSRFNRVAICKTLVLAGVISLAGCTNVAVTGAQVAYNHKNIQNQLNDHYITMRASQAINNMDKPTFADANISVSTVNGEVMLTGEAPQAWQKEEATRLVNEIPGVRKVYNLVTLSSPSSALTRLSDTWITTKVKGRIIASNDIDATRIKVVTENGTVFLMGTLTPEQADVAVDIARRTSGVKSVVKVLKYMQITDKA